MHGEKAILNCLRCGTPFLVSERTAKKRHFRFCSLDCYQAQRKDEAWERVPVWTCEQCGKEFRRKPKGDETPRFCSVACHGAARTGLTRAGARPFITKACRKCGAEFQTRAADRLYCSPTCQFQHRKAQQPERACENCGKHFNPRHSGSRFCSRPCLYDSNRGERAAGWKGGRHVTGQGYVKVYVKDHAAADKMGYVLEHRLVMGQILGRPLEKHEQVHHINGDRADNRPENLQLRQGKHGNGIVMVCADCGSHNIVSKPITGADLIREAEREYRTQWPTQP